MIANIGIYYDVRYGYVYTEKKKVSELGFSKFEIKEELQRYHRIIKNLVERTLRFCENFEINSAHSPPEIIQVMKF